jgi:hypothetical protein
VSKLDQWQIVFDHAQGKGVYLHFKLQETEIDDNARGRRAAGTRTITPIAEALDGGELGPERKLYLRELVARFGYALALNWNLGEENTQSPDQQRAMANYIANLDPYKHHVVAHTYPDEQELVLMSNADALVGNAAHDNSLWCLTRPGEIYLVYLPSGGTTNLDLSGATGQFSVRWFDPRNGGALKRGSVDTVRGGTTAALGTAPDNPSEDWLIAVRR